MTELVQIAIPQALDGPDAALLSGILDVYSAISLADLGNIDHALPKTELAGMLLASKTHNRRLVAAVIDGEVVGWALVTMPLTDNLALAQIDIQVHPAHRRRGIGGELLEWAEGAAHAEGRTIFQTWGKVRPLSPNAPYVTAPVGGDYPADAPLTGFLTKRGYALEQVDRGSRLTLPMDRDVFEALKADAEAGADGYQVHVWPAPVPEDWIDNFAALRSKVTSDAPSAGLEIEEEVWDAERLRIAWQKAAQLGQRQLIVAAEHLATHRLVAFTLVLCNVRPQVAWQGYTFVVGDHRGHRLGLLVKTTMASELASREPDVTRIYTENADENAPMLAINQAMGFVLDSLDGTFQKKIA